MTRFARAKGSKSSNERAPEDSTPWGVMKEQLLQAKVQGEEAKKREEAEKQRIENYENFLKEHKTQKRKATWCDFPESDKIQSQDTSAPISSKNKKNKQKHANGNNAASPPAPATADINAAKSPSKKNKKKKLKNQSEPTTQTNANVTSQKINSLPEDHVQETKNKFKHKRQLKEKTEESQESNTIQINGQSNQNSETTSKNKKKKKPISNFNASNSEGNENNQSDSNNKSNQNNKQQMKKKKEPKFVDGMPARRKPINNHSFQLIINGKDVELVRFDGFPIMKKDAERLEELKSNMTKKGIPKSEVNRTLKLERRRAEKALARLKRDVCYNCRKGGHNLSDCPELKTKIPGVGAPDGVCFKCGSTEHKQFECKVQKDKEFRFATCFICKEPGHIARQCPDNPKGLYPNGGGCKLCGDVTHLRKDCPTVMGKKEETSIKLQTLDSTDTLEGIEHKTNTSPQETTKKPKKIKF